MSPNRRNLLLATLALAVGLSRWLTRSQLFYNWDSVQYALGVGLYDLRLHQPHPPGSYFYVLAGRLLTLLTGDAHTSLLLVSAAAGAVTVLALFALGREVAGEVAGWWAACLSASAPLFWFYGSVGLNYSLDGLFAALVGLYSYRLCRGSQDTSTALWAGLWLGIAGGVRPTTLLFLAPVWLLGLACAARRNLRGALGSAVLVAALTLAWVLPTAAASAGFANYLRLNREMSHLLDATAVWRVPFWRAVLRHHAFTHLRCLESMLGVAWLLLPVAAWAAFRGGQTRHASLLTPHASRESLPRWLFWAAWIGPAALFYLLAHFNLPGYSLVYAPAILALAAGFLSRWQLRTTTRAAVMAAVAAGDVLLFWFGFPWAGPELGSRAISRAEIAQHDAYWRSFHRYLKLHHPPRSVRILASGTSTEGLRTVQGLLPEYSADVCQVVDFATLDLPASIRALRFLRFCDAAAVSRDALPALGVLRTREDRSYHRNSFRQLLPDPIPTVPIGGGFKAALISSGQG